MRLVLVLVLLLSSLPLSAKEDRPTILVVGDSISAGYGVAVDDGWVGRLSSRLDAKDYPHRVVNASITGDTTSGGRARLPDALDRHEPAIVVIELGGNDGLRGQPLEAMRANLRAMIEAARGAGARVLLLGIRLPPNYGRAYIDRFIGVYEALAEDTGVALVPRVLDGVGERREFMQDDGIHPNADGHEVILDNVWPTLLPLLKATSGAT
ncbi:arylesterase [Halofilum ochraceum]|uniref:arylesterase n=1 Tax=Halofilum ochraceum TaxID=1611323 RepID=UPI0008DA1F89|nr:arylesterase [Halofilum ochraceum]